MSRRQCHPALLGLAVFLLAGTESPAAAQPAFQPPEQDRARDAVRDGRLLPLSQVLAAIAARSPGDHLDTRFGETVAGRPVYLVTWRTQDNRVVVFVVDARTGRILDQRGD
ncbi:MAG: PepSY domain-containing protein [Phenylobacterium sp.]|uniref:PepSY domain-containing protein n=1 Tax=Phenylobacterium sp. TaxID=1871053 RepID=UPI0025D2DF09|nr:PepSY domain-containing protein [Phenylobacterium sp.]MCA3731426.1 PepSY domain-containing protein [Phenylobacterium sp.]MCA4917264.1 PepSY domain-containing protein [Phenylobacterium sp.]